MAETTVERDDENARYTIAVDGELAGYTEIQPDGEGRLRMPHTVIIPSFRGQGLAGALVAGALADIAARGETVVPLCPVVRKYLRENEVEGLGVEWPDA
ncbi:N-acetyltransferase [Microbacterium horticulturae]|uniref:N-acetyltransferase n=1 Tax=Microbacterium horticulturae TaxID=3028316 RepID=A0ABY8C242_9MICO|nr:GNAT family N-acetyltransferase [Microbacterium sp. KACC 23027]WEG09121.1 N-acetyltransferase [Microbacterium sp. KACC 23027]